MGDISSLSTKKANDEGRPLVLVDPSTGDDLINDAGEPMVILLVGSDSKEYRQYQSQIANKYRTRGKDPSLGQAQKMSIELLAKSTRGFENLQLNGEAIEFSTDGAEKLYSNYAIIKDQVDEFVHERTNFLE